MSPAQTDSDKPAYGTVPQRITIVDAQLHVWKTLPRTHWTMKYERSHLDPFPVEYALSAMDAVGVKAALVHVLGTSPGGSDEDKYSEEISGRFPGRIATVAAIEPSQRDVEDTMLRCKQRGVLAVRTFFRDDAEEAAYARGDFGALLKAARTHAMPVMMFVMGRLPLAARIAADHPDVQFIVDHLGMPQPPRLKRDTPPFAKLPEVIALAQYPNVALKLTGAPSYSDASHPFDDVWPSLHQILRAFGVSRLMWGSDMTRFWGLLTYAELLNFIAESSQLSASEKDALLGANLMKILRWPAPLARPVSV